MYTYLTQVQVWTYVLVRVHNRGEYLISICPIKMSLSSNSVYSSVFTYNPYVLTGPYRYLTFMASVEPHRTMCIPDYISISIVGFGDSTHTYKVDTPTSHQKQTCYPSP